MDSCQRQLSPGSGQGVGHGAASAGDEPALEGQEDSPEEVLSK